MTGNIKENDLFSFFEVIRQLEPQSVLDIGPLLKRAGGVSRKAMNMEITEKIRFDGVDFDPQVSFLVWNNVYDEMMSIKSFWEQTYKRKYDCTFLIGMDESEWKTLSLNLLEKIQACSRYVLTGYNYEEWTNKGCKVKNLKVETDSYYLYDFGE